MREKKKTAIRHYTEGFIFILPRFLYTRKLSLDDGYFSIPFFFLKRRLRSLAPSGTGISLTVYTHCVVLRSTAVHHHRPEWTTRGEEQQVIGKLVFFFIFFVHLLKPQKIL